MAHTPTSVVLYRSRNRKARECSRVRVKRSTRREITCRADIPAVPRTCRRARRKSPICSDIRWVDGSNPEEDRTPSDRSARRTNRRSILEWRKEQKEKEKRRETKRRKNEKTSRNVESLRHDDVVHDDEYCDVSYVCFLTWQTLYFSGLVANVVRVWMLRGWYLAGLLLPFRNVSKSRVEGVIYVIYSRVVTKTYKNHAVVTRQ